MKCIFLFLSLLISLNSFGQLSVSKETGLLFEERIINLDSLSKEKIYSKTKNWFGDTFANSKEVITSDNPEEGTITGSYIKDYPLMTTVLPFIHTVKVFIKDGKAKIIVSNIATARTRNTAENYFIRSDGSFPKMGTKRIFEELNAGVATLLNSYESYFKTNQSTW